MSPLYIISYSWIPKRWAMSECLSPTFVDAVEASCIMGMVRLEIYLKHMQSLNLTDSTLASLSSFSPLTTDQSSVNFSNTDLDLDLNLDMTGMSHFASLSRSLQKSLLTHTARHISQQKSQQGIQTTQATHNSINCGNSHQIKDG